LTISFISSSDVAGREVVADSTTKVETWLIKGDSRCRARCWRTGEGTGAVLVDEGKARSDADNSVEAQCIAVKPSCRSAQIPDTQR
jgi:hypothetical protein